MNNLALMRNCPGYGCCKVGQSIYRCIIVGLPFEKNMLIFTVDGKMG